MAIVDRTRELEPEARADRLGRPHARSRCWASPSGCSPRPAATAGLDDLELKDADPIRFEKLFSRLRGGLVTARETALNISASPIVKEIGELCFALYTPEGDSVALSTGIIVHVHTMSDAIKYMVRAGLRGQPGDRRRATSSPTTTPMIGDVHNADVQTIVPIFWEGELIGWAGGVTHEIDIGAKTPGSRAASARSPASRTASTCPRTKIGTRRRAVARPRARGPARAPRTPMYWTLDEKTRLAGCHMIREAVERVILEEGVDTYKQFIREVIEDGRRVVPEPRSAS